MMNLNKLPKYKMVTPPGTLPKEKSNLKHWFDKSISTSDVMAMLRIKLQARDVVPDPSREPKYMLQSLVESVAERYGRPFRFMFENEATRYGLTIDIFDVKQCPLDLVDPSLLTDDSFDGNRMVGDVDVPLLCCRYTRIRVENEQDAVKHIHTWMEGYEDEIYKKNVYGSGDDNKPMAKVQATVACIDYIHDEILEKHRKQLSPAYLEAWRRESKHNRSGFYKPGFIVPLPKLLTLLAKKIPENRLPCARQSCDNKGSKKCGRCKAAHYCSEECQKEHWKEHKKVCGKSAEELLSEESDNSLIVPISDDVPSGMDGGPVGFVTSFSLNGGVAAAHNPTSNFRDIHRDNCFLVKLQLGLAESMLGLDPNGALLVYDRTRSLSFWIRNERQPVHRQLFEVVSRRGVPCDTLCGLRAKGYLWAKREGMNLRLFVDQLEPVQPW